MLKMSKEPEEPVKLLATRLDTLNRLIVVNTLRDKSPTERIAILLDFGLKQKVIADLLGTKPNIVSATKSNIEKAKKGKKRRKRKAKSKTAVKEKGAGESATNQPSASSDIK